MSVIPSEQNTGLNGQIEKFVEVLNIQLLGNHGLEEKEFYSSGLFRGAIQLVGLKASRKATIRREAIVKVESED